MASSSYQRYFDTISTLFRHFYSEEQQGNDWRTTDKRVELPLPHVVVNMNESKSNSEVELQEEFFCCHEWQLTKLKDVAFVVCDNHVTTGSQSALILEHILIIFRRTSQSIVKLGSIARQYRRNFSGTLNHTIAFLLATVAKDMSHIGIG